MRILIEEHKYIFNDIKEFLWDGLSAEPDGTITIEYVGYYYNQKKNECVLFLPRVLLEDWLDGNEYVFVERDENDNVVFDGYTPEEIFHLDKKDSKGEYLIAQRHRDFLRNFAVWIYRAIDVYYSNNKDSKIILRKFVPIMGRGPLRESHTLLDVILALLQFQKDNHNLFLTTLHERHSGFNKVNWAKTVAKGKPIFSNGAPIYVNPINKKREIDFEEDLFVIFYSILSYIKREYGFAPLENPGFEELSSAEFQRYLNFYGRIRLNQIKEKYFSDLTVQLWQFCYAFFEHHHKIKVSSNNEEYLIAKNFNIVFETIIDDLVGDKNIPVGLKEQQDGKRVDHMYKYRSLTNIDSDEDVYYIGDSKYYKRRTKVGEESVYKQFTYARNVIQWNLNLFLEGDKNVIKSLRDEKTEGYQIIPNFFISARIDKLSYDDDEITRTSKEAKSFFSRQFENRLFDRDTLLVTHFDVNFLYIISRYARNNKLEKRNWREKVRKIFRDKIREELQANFNFYAITPKAQTDSEKFFNENFYELNGKVYDAYGLRSHDGKQYEYFSLALRNPESAANKPILKSEIEQENTFVLGLIDTAFNRSECILGEAPETIESLIPEDRYPFTYSSSNLLTLHNIENYKNSYFLVGYCKGEVHENWMLSKSALKKSAMYNIRIDTNRLGAVSPNAMEIKATKFLILYYEDTESTNKYHIFRLNGGKKQKIEWMESTGYRPSDSSASAYYCFNIEEEVSFGNPSIAKLITMLRTEQEEKGRYTPGMPFFVTGFKLKEMI